MVNDMLQENQKKTGRHQEQQRNKQALNHGMIEHSAKTSF
jgi:hypothetical protein